MPDNIYLLPNIDVDPEVLLSKAQHWELDEVLVIGWDKDGNFLFGGNMTNLSDISWLLRTVDNWVRDRMRDVE